MSAREYGEGGIVVQKNEAVNPGSAVTVLAAASTAIVAERAQRTHLFISNDGANVVYVRLAASGAVINSGIRLAAGAVFQLDRYTGPVSARAAVGDTVVTVVEV